jgi:hypothetical protein
VSMPIAGTHVIYRHVKRQLVQYGVYSRLSIICPTAHDMRKEIVGSVILQAHDTQRPPYNGNHAVAKDRFPRD